MSKSGAIGNPIASPARPDEVRDQTRKSFEFAQAEATDKRTRDTDQSEVGRRTDRTNDDSPSTIGQRLAQVRRAAGVTQFAVANIMGTTQPSLARFEKDQALPNLGTVMRYAKAIGHDVKATLVKEKSPHDEIFVSLDGLPVKFAQFRKEQGITQVQVAHRMKTTQPIIARFERGSSMPNVTTLKRYASAIGFTLGLSLHQTES